MLVNFLMIWLASNAAFLTATATTEQSQSQGNPRIHISGARPVKEREFPYLVMLHSVMRNISFFFTGTIPSSSTVLSTSFYIMDNLTAYAGLVRYNVTEMDTSESDKPVEESKPELRNDQLQVRSVVSVVAQNDNLARLGLVICYVDKPWVWSGYVEAVSLHLTKTSLDESGMCFQVMGFGPTEEDGKPGVAHVMNQQIGNYSLCKDLIPPVMSLMLKPDANEYVLCSTDVKDKTICRGDYGGAAMYNDKQWAVIYYTPTTICNLSVECNLYIDIAYYRDWILKNIKEISAAGSIHCCSVKFSIYGVLVCEPLWLFLLTAVEVLYLH